MFAASVELTRKKYVVFGESPGTVTECDTTDPGEFAVRFKFEELVPYDTTDVLDSLVVHVITAVVDVGAALIDVIVGGKTSGP